MAEYKNAQEALRGIANQDYISKSEREFLSYTGNYITQQEAEIASLRDQIAGQNKDEKDNRYDYQILREKCDELQTERDAANERDRLREFIRVLAPAAQALVCVDDTMSTTKRDEISHTLFECGQAMQKWPSPDAAESEGQDGA